MTVEYHLWRCDLDREVQWPDVLDEHEIKRARAFAFPRLRDRFIAAHCFLRIVLGKVTGLDPAALRFGFTPPGKPYLATTPTFGPAFNLSHSEGVAWLLIAPQGATDEVGIDVEVDRAIPDAVELGATVFTAKEMGELRQLEGQWRDRAFLTCWTRKEAYLKALGLGLGLLDLTTIEAGTFVEPVLVPSMGGTSKRVQIRSIEVSWDERVAIATTKSIPRTKIHEFDVATV